MESPSARPTAWRGLEGIVQDNTRDKETRFPARNPDASRVVFYWPVTRPSKGEDSSPSSLLKSEQRCELDANSPFSLVTGIRLLIHPLCCFSTDRSIIARMIETGERNKRRKEKESEFIRSWIEKRREERSRAIVRL